MQLARAYPVYLALAACTASPPPARPPAPAAPKSAAATPGAVHVPAALPTPTSAWQTGAAARALVAPWRASCPDLVAGLDEPGLEPRVRTTTRGIEIEQYSAGSGRWAVFEETHALVPEGACDGLGYQLSGGKEATLVYASAEAGSAPHLAALAEAASARPEAAEHAAARLLVHAELAPSTDTRDLLGPPAAIQPEHAGPPRGSPRTYWDRAAIEAAGLPDPDLAGETGTHTGALVFAIADPVRLATHGNHVLYQTRFRARLGGGLLAIHDRARDRTRWVFGTTLDPVKHFRIVASAPDLIVVKTGEGADRALWAIDLPRGIVRRLGVDVEAAFVKGTKRGVVVLEGGTRHVVRAADL